MKVTWNRGWSRLIAVVAMFPAGMMLLVEPAAAQEWTIVEDSEWCQERSWDARYCEVREITLPAGRDVIRVDGGKNGGIRVEGGDANTILVQAKVHLWEVSREEIDDYLSEIVIETEGEIRASGPRRTDRGNWAISYRLVVPRASNLELSAHNGGITISDVSGEIEFSARNGGVRLSGVGGDVYGRTRNGGLDIRLQGDRWEGEGLDVETKNGGVKLHVPEEYSARLLMGTVNGGISSDLPVAIRGRREKHLRATLGDGGALLRITTTNGGVSIRET